MADVSKITLLNGSTYDIKDAEARSGLSAKYTKPASGIPASDLAAGVIPEPWDGSYEGGSAPFIPDPASSVPVMDGTAAVGVSTDYARADHVHPAELPTVTSSDNGKVLRVVSGVWAAASLPSAAGVSF